MSRSSRLRRHPLPRRLRSTGLATVLVLLAGPSLATAANPAKATSFVRGPAFFANDAGDYPQRAIVGDVNGDGRDDSAFSSGYGTSSVVSVVYGASPTADVDLTADLGTRGFRIASGSNAGVKDVAAAGDFDHDGIDDLIVSTDVTSFVVYGARSTTGTLTLAAGGRVTALTGKGAGDVEDDVDPAGDFDGDGYDDVVVQRGAIGAAIVSGGPRVSSIALGAATGRVSLINSQQRCGFVWFTFKCVYMGVPVEPLGDFDGDGLADLAIENANTPGNYVLYGRTGRFTTVAEAGSGKTTLPTPTQSEVASEVSDYSAAGDITGDGRADALAWGTVIVPGRTGRPSSIANSTPVIRLTSPTLSRLNAFAAGDQDGDGRADLVVATGGNGNGSGYVIRTLTNFTRTAPATVNADTGTAISGVPTDYVAYTGVGDLDGDRLGDLLVATVYPGESAYLVTHGTGGPGSSTRAARLEGDLVLLDAGGAPVTYWSGTLQATCAGRTTAKLPLGYPTTVLFTDAAEGDSCVVTAAATLDNPTPYANCTWVDTLTLNDDTPVTSGGAFTLKGGTNTVRVVRQCKLPATAPPAAFSSTGWLTAGIATQPGLYDRLWLTNGPDQVSSLVWPYAVDLRNQTIEFDALMSGGNGSAEGMTVAFVRTGAYGPAGGTVGGGGQLLGFGGLVGSAVAFDVNQGPGDPSSNFIGFTNTYLSDESLSWLRTAPAVVPLRNSSGHHFKIVNKNGTTTVSIDGTVRLSGALSIPAKTHLAFTASTSATYQYTSAWNLAISPS
ncbi:MAG: VCBS repeat-containing protein [Solirubrobacteraceae bacterium]|nr:VCBS repeat-containing protein [Solirubrobacteraceae bacterium]